MYFSLFEKALKAYPENRVGLNQPECGRQYLNSQFFKELPYLLMDNFGFVEDIELLANGFHFHRRLQSILKHYFESDVFFTMGSIQYNNQELYHNDFDTALRVLEQDAEENNDTMHCWLTLPTMEIIDLSIKPKLSLLDMQGDVSRDIVCQHADRLTEPFSYVPQIATRNTVFKELSFDRATEVLIFNNR